MSLIEHPVEKEETVQAKVPQTTFSLRETTEILIKHLGVHKGKYDLAIEFNIGLGRFGMAENQLCLGAMVCVSKIGIVEQPNPIIYTVDATECNPLPKTRKTKS